MIEVIVASPGDVEPERDAVKDALTDWNSLHSSREGVTFVPKRWELNSAPLMGKRPQEIINGQVLDSCDLLIAVFWTRLGTPTGVARSGTLEEIQRHVDAGKLAMIYFCTRDLPQSFDVEQWQGLVAYRQSLERQGLLKFFSTTDDLKLQVSNHLTIHTHTHPLFGSMGAKGDASGGTLTEAKPDRAQIEPFNMFWLGHDLLWTKNRLALGGDPGRVVHGLSQALLHLQASGYSNEDLANQLRTLKSRAENDGIGLWTNHYRQEFDTAVDAVIAELDRHLSHLAEY